MATEAADIPDPISLTQKRDGVEDKELTSELSYTIVNEVPMEEEKNSVESSVNQPPETIEILEKTEHMQVVNGKEVPNVNVVDEGNVGNIEGEIFLKSSSVSDEKPMRNTEENQSITKEELSDLQDEKGCITDKNIIVEGSYAKAGPDVGYLEEKTSMAYEDRSQEIVELSEKMKDVTTIDVEVQNKNFESSFVEKLENISFPKVDNLETSKEESAAGMKYIVKESPDEADDQNEILRNIATTDRNLSTTGKVDENPEPKAEESMRESEDLTPPEALTMECKHERLMVLASEDNAEDKEKEKTETSKHEEHSVQSFVQKNEPAKANLGSPLDVTSEEIETPSPSEYAETMTNIEEQRPVGIPQEILGETRQDETIIADDINKNENPEAKNVSTVDLDEKTRSMEVEISSKNGNELYVTHPPIEETVKGEGEQQDEVSMSESGGRLHEVFEIPMEEAKRVNETFEASKSPEGIILEHTSTEGALNMKVTLATSELNINPEKGCELNSEKEIKEINAEENIKEETEQKEKAFDTEIQIATKSDDNEKSTTEEVVPVKNTTLCTGEEEYHHDQEDKNETLSSKEASPKLDTGDQGCRTSNETKNINDQIINEEAIQVYEDVKIADRGENKEKEMENEEHTVMDRSPESNGKHTTKCSQENEMDAEKQKAKIGEELETTNKSEVIEKQILAEENRVQDGLTVSAGEEFGTESSKEDDMTTKMSKEEVLETLQTADGSAKIGIQTKKEDGTSKDKFVARDGEETKNECSYGNDEEKESDIEISLMNEDLNAQSITRSSEEETAQKESNLDIVENSSSVPEISEKGIKEEKEDSQITMVAEETSLTEVEEKYKMPVDSSDMVSVEMGLLTTETSEMESNDIDNTEKPTETLNLDENEAMEILTASKHGADETAEKTEPEGKNESCDAISKTQNQREIATAETFLDEISDQNLQASSTLTVEEHNIMTPVSEATSEAPENDKTLYGKEETPIVGETTEEDKMEEDESTNPKNDTKMEPIEIEKESANDDAQNEDPELYTPPEVNNEKSISESDVELLNRVNTSEVTKCGEMGKLETSEDKMPSDTGIEKDKSEYKTEVNEATKGVEADGGCTDTDKDILEHEDSAKDFEGSSKNSIEIEKAPDEFEIEGHSHGSEASETKSISTLTEKTIETVEHGENHRSAPDSMVEDESNRRMPETNQANIPEESHDDENHTTDSTKEQISGQDIEEESTKMNEEIEPKLESQKEINKTQDTILNEKVPSEIQRAVETEIIEEQTMQEESCTKELHMIPEADETVNEVRELDLTSIGSLETTSSNNNTEMVKSKVEEDLNQESKAMNEDINEPIEKPVNVLSSVSEVSAEKIEEENIEDTENCDDNADTAPTVVTDVTSLGEFQLNGEPVEAIDTSSDAKNLEATKTANSSQHDAEVDSMKIEGTSSIELQLPVHEHEKADNESITLEKSDANDVEVEETKIPDESKDQDVKEIHETGTSLTVEETDANEIEKQIREVPEALPQPINQAIEADIGADIISPTVATEVTNLGEVQLNDESVKVLDTSSDAKSLERTKTADDNQQDAEVDSLKLQETFSMVYQLPMQEHEKEDNVSVTVEKSDANDVEAKETKIPETVPESKDQGIKETHETGTSLIVGVIDANETEKQISGVPEALSEPINKGVEAARDEEITLGQTLQAEKIEEPLQVPSSSLISEKQDSETTTTIEKSEDESTKKDDTQVDNLKHEENSGMVSELPITECESANNETVEKLDADEVEAKETETLEAVSESKDQGFQEIHETRTSPTTENTESDKIEEGFDAVADDETSDHPHPVGKLEEQLQVSSSALNCETSTTSKMDDESTKKDETEVDKIEPEEAIGMLSKSPTIEYENADADEVQVETKTYEAISESTGDDVEEIHERIQPSTDTEDEENKGLEMPCDSTKDDFMSKDIACPDNQKTDKVIETSEAAGDTLDSSLFTAPIEDECSEKPVQDVKGNLDENSSMACEDGSQETVILSEKMKDVTSIEDEVQNQNLESFFVKEVEDICLQKADSPETSKEESETGMKDIVNESQNEEDNRNDILENIVTPDTNLSTIGKDDENPEPKPDASFREPNESMRRESEDIIPTEELTMECQQEGFMVVAGEDNIVAAQQDQPETSNHEEHSEKSSFMQETEPATANLGSPLDVASGEIETTAPNEYAETITNIEAQRMDGIPQKILGETIEDEIKKDENPEGKNLSTVDLDEKTRSTEVEIPNKNDNELYVTHPTVEETVQLGVEKQDEVSMSESGDQLHEAFEVPTEEEKHVNETYKASKSPQSTILDHTSIGEALNMDVTSTTNELDINLEHGSELNSEKEVKEINAEETIKEEIEQKEKASDTEIQISTRSDDNERSTIEEDVTVKNDTPLCTGEEDYHHDQEDEIGPNSSKEASIELDSGDQSCRTSSETKNVNDHIINEETIQEYEEPKITDRGEEAEKEMKIEDHTEMGQKLETTSKSEGIEKQVLAEESRDQDWPTVSAGEELGTESPQEDEMKTKTSKEEVLEILQTADGSANIGIQTKEEDGTSKDNFVACEGEEIKNGYSCDKENEDKEPDTVVLEKNHGGQDTSEQIVKSSARNQSAESFLEKTVRESSQEDEASEEYETAGASTTTEESAITDLHSSSVGEEEVQENLKEDKTETMRSEKEASEKYKTARASMTMEEISITDLPSSSVGEEEVEENLKEDITETMRSEKEASEEYETAGVSMTMEESAITDLPSSSVEEEKVQENLKEDETEAMRSEKEACEEHETVEASTTMEKSAIIDLPSSFVGEEKVEENLKENKTEAMKSEKEASEYETVGASTTIEVSAITDLPSSSVGEEKVQENLKEDKAEEMRSEKEAIEEYETVGASITMEESAITDLPSSSVGEEKVQQNLKEDETEAMRSEKEASEEYETVGASTTMEESAITDLPSLSTVGEEKFQEYLKEGKTETMRSEQEASEEYETAGGSTTMEESTITDLPSSTVGEEKVQENLKEDETEAMRSEKEASEEYETAGGSMTMEESTITDLPSSTVGEGKVQENLKEDETEAMRSEKEVRNSNIECIERDFVTTLSTKEREANTLQDEAETNDGFNYESFTRSSEEETAKKESNLDLVENYSSVPDISEKDIKEEILEKADSEATVVIEETSLTEAEVEHKMQVDSSNMVSEEKGLLTTETSEMESNGIDTIAKTIETSNLGENKDMEIPTARKHGADEAAEKIEPEGKNETCDAISNTEDQREIATVETSLDDISEQNLQASSTTSLEEHNFLTPDVSETRVEAPEKDKTLYGNAETPIVAETTEENTMEKEDESTNQINNTNVEPIEIEKESANDDAQNEDQESYTSPEMNNEKSTSESDIKILKSVSTSQIPDCSEIGKLETVEDEKLSDTGLEKDQSDYEMAVSADSKGVEADGGCIETEKAIQEKEDSAMNFEENSKESVEIKKPQVEFEAGGHSHGTEDSETKSISTLTEKVPREIERATESEIIEEQTTEEESCTKEPQMIAVADETINEMRDLDLTPSQSLETTASNDNTEMVKSKLAEDLNQESEASSMKITMKDEIKKPIEKPVNVSSLVSEVSEEKFEEENIEDTENCDDDTNIAPTVLTDVTNVGEVQLNDKPVKALDTSSDAKSLEPATIADTSQHDAEVDSMKLESDANDVEAEGTKIPDSVSESKDQGVKEIYETDTILTVGETETNEIDKQIKEVPEALSEPLNQGVETASNDEIIAPTVAIEVTSVGKVQVNDEPVNALDTSSDAKSLETTKAADIIQQDEEVDSMRPKEASTMVCQLPIHEHEKAGNEISVEKSDANDDEVEELKISDAVPDSKDQCVKEFNKTGTSLIMGETDANEIEKQIREVPEGLSEPINQGVEADRDDEITPGQTLQAEKIDEQLQEEQLQVSSSSLISKEQDSETTTTIEKSEDGSTKKDDTQVDNLKPVESSGMVSELPITNCESANNETVEKLDADEVEVEETKTLDAVSESKDQGFEEIHETGTSQTTENALTDKIEQEIQEANEKISDPIYQGVDSVVDGETSDHPLPLGKLEDESTKEDETEIDNIELVEATGMLSKLPAIEHKNADMSATIEKSDANEVQVEESKTSEAISESKVHGVEEIHEIGPSLTVGNTHTDKVEEIKEAPDTIYKPAYQCVEAVIDRDITINKTLPTQRNEQLQEPSSALPKEQNDETPTNVELIKDESTKKDETQPNENVAYSFPTSITEKPCLQDEGPRELDVSNLELKAQESQIKAPEEESIALEETSTVEPQEYIPEIKCADCPMEYEIIPIQCSSQGTLKDEDIINSGDSNKESDNLPPQGEVGEMCEEASNLKFEKTAKVLESVSEIYSPEVPPTSEGIEIIEEQLKGVITETRDGKNHSKETTEADEAIKKDNSNGKAIDEEHKQITEENPVARNSHSVSPHEETVTKSNQEDELRAEDYPGKRTNITFEIIENEIQHEELFEESEEAGEDKYIKETTTTEDKTFKDGKVSVGDGTANVSPPEEAEDGKNIEKVPNRLDHENQGDETNFEDAATEATAPNKEFKPSEVMLVSHEKDRTCDDDEETVMRNDEHLQNTDLVVPPVIDAAAEEAPDEKVRENFEEVSEPAPKGPTHRTIETYEENKEIASADTNNSENLMDNDKLESRFLQPACEESGVREDKNLKEQEVSSNIPSISSCAATSHEKIADKESEKTADKKDGFVSDKQTTEAVGILEQEKSIQFEEHTKDEEPVELSTMGNERKLDETKIHSKTTTNGDEETQYQNEKPNVLSHIKDSSREVSHEKGIMDLDKVNQITEGTQDLEKTSIAISHEQIARRANTTESAETTNSTASKDIPQMHDDPTTKIFQNPEIEDLKAGYASGFEPEATGVECGEEKRMGEESEETTEKSVMIESAEFSLSDFMHGSRKQTLPVVEHLTEERELPGNKEEPQTESAERVQVEETKTEEGKDEYEEGDEHKRADSGSDAPVMVEASTDTDVKIVHKKHHNILSGVGSKVKHSLAKMKKAITGKSSHPKTPSAVK
ncbi:unnamed protein product [Camellia sinensis]